MKIVWIYPFIFFICVTGKVNAGVNSLLTVSDTISTFIVGHTKVSKFLWIQRSIYFDSLDIKRSKLVIKKRVLSNIFKEEFSRGTNLKFKNWDTNGNLINKGWTRPFVSNGKRKEIIFTYHENGKIKSKESRKKKGDRIIRLNKAWIKEYDKRGKKISKMHI